MLKFGLTAPASFWSMDLADKQAALAALADAGIAHIYCADHVSFRDGSGADGFVEVAALSQLHPAMGVMISIYLLPLRHPLPIARQLATMDKIAPGRMLFGIGVGGEDRHETEVCGVDPRTRGARANESLEIIRRLLDGETLDFDGTHFQLSAARIRPRQTARIPIIVGGRSNAALSRCARYGEGWIGVWCSARRFNEAVSRISEEAAELGRADVDWMHGYQPWLGLDTGNADRARQAVAEQMEAFYKVPFEQFERYTPFGTPAEVAEQLLPYVEAGARLMNFKVCTADPEDEVQLAAELAHEMRRLTG